LPLVPLLREAAEAVVEAHALLRVFRLLLTLPLLGVLPLRLLRVFRLLLTLPLLGVPPLRLLRVFRLLLTLLLLGVPPLRLLRVFRLLGVLATEVLTKPSFYLESL
jgi:hypothetical protein